jgi:hypothetical protein
MRTHPLRATLTTTCFVMMTCAIIACASAPAASDISPARGDSVQLRVVNSRAEDIEIYVVRGAVLSRIGRVRSAGREVLSIPPDIVASGSVQLGVSPQSYGDPMVSRVILIGPGDTVEWSIEQNLPLSQLRVRRKSGG